MAQRMLPLLVLVFTAACLMGCPATSGGGKKMAGKSAAAGKY